MEYATKELSAETWPDFEWGAEAPAHDAVYIDLYDPYLEPA